jgi:hypothetical protein
MGLNRVRTAKQGQMRFKFLMQWISDSLRYLATNTIEGCFLDIQELVIISRIEWYMDHVQPNKRPI